MAGLSRPGAIVRRFYSGCGILLGPRIVMLGPRGRGIDLRTSQHFRAGNEATEKHFTLYRCYLAIGCRCTSSSPNLECSLRNGAKSSRSSSLSVVIESHHHTRHSSKLDHFRRGYLLFCRLWNFIKGLAINIDVAGGAGQRGFTCTWIERYTVHLTLYNYATSAARLY